MLSAIQRQRITLRQQMARMIDQGASKFRDTLSGHSRNREPVIPRTKIRLGSKSNQPWMARRVCRRSHPQEYVAPLSFVPRAIDPDGFDDIVGVPQPRGID
jgi:hypothetical protein